MLSQPASMFTIVKCFNEPQWSAHLWGRNRNIRWWSSLFAATLPAWCVKAQGEEGRIGQIRITLHMWCCGIFRKWRSAHIKDGSYLEFARLHDLTNCSWISEEDEMNSQATILGFHKVRPTWHSAVQLPLLIPNHQGMLRSIQISESPEIVEVSF